VFVWSEDNASPLKHIVLKRLFWRSERPSIIGLILWQEDAEENVLTDVKAFSLLNTTHNRNHVVS